MYIILTPWAEILNLHLSHLFAHHVPVSFFDPGIAEGADQRHVDLKLLQFALDRGRGSEWALKLRTPKNLGQLVGCAPEVLDLSMGKLGRYGY